MSMGRLAPAAPPRRHPPPPDRTSICSQTSQQNGNNNKTYLKHGEDSKCKMSFPREDHTSDLSSESSTTSSNTVSSSQIYSLTSLNKYQDSDNDSGIVTGHCNRISSTSSTDTDVSHLEGPPPMHISLKPDFAYANLKLKSPTEIQIGPIRGNHSILSKDKINLPQQRLSLPADYSVNSGSHLVRFEDDLQLSEQNVRRSCRKLFAQLYAQQNKSLPDPSGVPRMSVYQPTTLPKPSQPSCRHSSASAHVPSQTQRRIPKKNRHSMLDRSPSDESDIVHAYARPASVIPDSPHLQHPRLQAEVRVTSETTIPKSLLVRKCTKDEEDANWSKLEQGLLTPTTPPELPPKTSYCNIDIVNLTITNQHQSRPRVNSQPCLTLNQQRPSSRNEEKQEPKKSIHKSDFALYQRPAPSPSPSLSPTAPELGRSRSFLDRVNGLTRTARSALQRAFSQERIYRPEQEERYDANGRPKKDPANFVQGIKQRVSKRTRRKRKDESGHTIEVDRVERSVINPCLWGQDMADGSFEQVWGQLLQLNVDGSQVIELSRPQGMPFGFFVARGRVKNSKGVFVSRMRDPNTQKILSGLLEVGDEILEIDGTGVKDAEILEVNALMAKKQTLLLTVLPYICRKDI